MTNKNASSPKYLTIGNALTVLRLVLLPVMIVSIVKHAGYVTVITMAVVVISDLLDGRVSRRLGQASAFGGFLDSIIDFVFIYSLFIAFYVAGRIYLYQFVVLYAAMLMTLLLQLVSMGSGQSEGILRTRTGKTTGVLQYLYLLFLVICEVLPESNIVSTINIVLFSILTLFVILSSSGAVIRLRRMTAAK